jgi:hypothetical protein
MKIEAINNQRRVTIGAFDREDGASEALLGFTNDEAGRHLKERARRELAAGNSVEFTRGIRAFVTPPPKILEDLDVPSLGDVVMTIRPPEPVEVEMMIEAPERELRRRFLVRSIPPKQAGHHAFASLADSLWIEIDLNLPGSPHVELSFTMSAEFGSDAKTNAGAAEFLLAYLRHTQIRFSGPPLFPEEGIAARVPVPESRPELETEVALRRDLYSDLAYIEERLGVELPIPHAIDREALKVIGTVSDILRSGKGTATFGEGRKVVPAAQLSQFPDVIPSHTRHQQVTYTLWGQVLDLGTGEYTIPEMTVRSIRPLMPTPDSPAEVLVGPADSDEATFHLVDRRERPRTASGGVLL